MSVCGAWGQTAQISHCLKHHEEGTGKRASGGGTGWKAVILMHPSAVFRGGGHGGGRRGGDMRGPAG